MVTTKPTLAALKKACKRIGIEPDIADAGRWVTVNVDAPDGMTWDANGCTTLVTSWMHGDEKFRAESITDILERMAMGWSEAYPCDE
jgi:hypothetical protein